MKILVIVPEQVHGVIYHRLIIPFYNLIGFKVTLVNNLDGLPDDNLKSFDIVYFSRMEGIGDEIKQLERLKKFGIKYVIDIDDYWNLPLSHALYPMYKKENASARIRHLIKNANLVTTTHDAFADIIRKINPNVAVLPNAIDPTQPQFQPSLNVNEKISFGWIGGIHHFEDLRIIKPCLQKVVNINCDMVLGGYSDNYMFNIYEDWFSDCGRNKNYHRLDKADVYNYAYMYDQLDVALIPLREDKFNSCKSNLKVIEAGFKKKAIIVSYADPYKIDCNKRNSIQCRNSNDFYKAIKKLSANPNMVIDLAEQLYLDVKDRYSINTVNELRREALNNLKN